MSTKLLSSGIVQIRRLLPGPRRRADRSGKSVRCPANSSMERTLRPGAGVTTTGAGVTLANHVWEPQGKGRFPASARSAVGSTGATGSRHWNGRRESSERGRWRPGPRSDDAGAGGAGICATAVAGTGAAGAGTRGAAASGAATGGAAPAGGVQLRRRCLGDRRERDDDAPRRPFAQYQWKAAYRGVFIGGGS